jgi:hypothetical protein
MGKNMVKSHWVFTNKYNNLGDIIAHKACLIAKGFTQVIGEDYDETFTLQLHVLNLSNSSVLLLSPLGLHLWQVDFISAFPNSDNVYEVYMEQPPGFEKGEEEDKV